MFRLDFQGLFWAIVFPTHFWTLLLVFRDFSTIAERNNNPFDAVGLASYGLVFTLAEDILLLIVLVVFSFFLPARWEKPKRTAFLAMLFFVMVVWAIIGQLYFLRGWEIPNQAIRFFASYSHPLRVLYGLMFVIVSLTVLFPVWLFVRSGRLSQILLELLERIKILSIFYIGLDVIGFVIILFRNLGSGD